MGKQTDAIKLIKEAFQGCKELSSVDLDYHKQDMNRLQVSATPIKSKSLPENFSSDLESKIFKIYSGHKQIEKLVEQRFTRDDFADQ